MFVTSLFVCLFCFVVVVVAVVAVSRLSRFVVVLVVLVVVVAVVGVSHYRSLDILALKSPPLSCIYTVSFTHLRSH